VTADVEVEGFVLRYDCDRAALGAELAARFVPLSYDADTEAFVRKALAAPHGWLATKSYALLRAVLSDYDAYALLGMYPMHLCSAAQFRASLPSVGASARPRRLLDVGAGSGAITATAASAGFDEVLVTEASRVLRARLRRRGYRVLDRDLGSEALPAELRADVVLCLNVLDRTSYPRTMLGHLREALLPGGRLLLSLPLPLRPHVQRAGHTVDPEELLPPPAGSWEGSAARIAAQLLEPCGLRVHTLSRVPYVCRGDDITRLYVLDAALFVCVVSDRSAEVSTKSPRGTLKSV
jgi:SAM-dependent methyltransferase